jgi:uncharacterized damage-inducible protein DinB
MKEFFIEKFHYNFDSNRRMINCVEASPKAYTKRAQELISHTLDAHHIWNCRILGSKPKHGVWDVYELNELHDVNTSNHELSLEIISGNELTDSVEYKNTSGRSFINRIDDILYHIINHSTYHRGQLMTDLKAHGVIPISTDYIFFKR